jgi:Multiubiquitin
MNSENASYVVDIEGHMKQWAMNTITTEDIIRLAGWENSQQVLEIDSENNERTLKPGETVELKEGHGFAKKIRFRRG